MNRRFPLLLVAVAAVLSSAVAGSAASPFTEVLTAEERQSAGLTKLSDEQTSTLNNLVEREMRLARQGNVPAFASEFSVRRSPPERVKAGLEKLSPEERSTLDALVARTIAAPASDVAVSAPQSNPSEAVLVGVGPKPFVRGEASFTVGTAGEGRNFYGGSVYVEHVDPQKGYTLGIGYSEYRGKGLWFYDDWYRYNSLRRGLPYGRFGWRY